MFKRFVTLLCLLSSVFYSLSAVAATPYFITDLGSPAGWSYAWDVNNSGQVSGYYYASGGSGTRYGYYYDGTMHYLNNLGTGSSIGYGISNSGWVSGLAGATGGSHSVIWKNPATSGTPTTDINSYLAGFQRGYAINDSGQVAGYVPYIQPTAICAGYYDGGTSATVLPKFATDPGQAGSGLGVDSTGTKIVGYQGKTVGAYPGVPAGDAALWSYNVGTWSITELGTVLGGTPSVNGNPGGPSDLSNSTASAAPAINSTGVVVGFTSNADNNIHAFTYDTTTAAANDLGALAGYSQSEGWGISGNGTVVGVVLNLSPDNPAIGVDQHAAVYSNGGWSTLNDLAVSLGSFTSLTQAMAISDNEKYVVGWGVTPSGDTHAFLAEAALLGDANLDGTVNINDLSKVLTNYDKTGLHWADGDFNGDGTVNISDLSNVLTNYDKTAGAASAGVTAVPEPSALALLAMGLATLLVWARARR